MLSTKMIHFSWIYVIKFGRTDFLEVTP